MSDNCKNNDVYVNIQAVAGRSLLNFKQFNCLKEGDVISLDRTIDEAVDIYANGALVAKGRVVTIDDKLGISITELVKNGIMGK